MIGKLIIITAPSGAGKTTIAKHLLAEYPLLEFSVSATTRPKRIDETEGRDYYFMTREEFREKIKNGDFIEWEEVYNNTFYGTLKSEVETIWISGKVVLFDVDVKGAINLKKKFGTNSLTIFIKPPDINILKKRLEGRATESKEKIHERINKALYEMEYAAYFDKIILNNGLSEALQKAAAIVEGFLFHSYGSS
ncbi:MAG: guanylate kinase [Chitinophagales bacterium]|nr:guanylate kinase [Chitinophagales bacterium]